MKILFLVFILNILISLPLIAGERLYDYTAEKKFIIPIREHAVIVGEQGYYPQNISLFAGEQIRFYLSTTMNRPSCLMIKEKNIFLSIEKGRITEASVQFDRPGTFKYYCPNGNISGTIHVLKRKGRYLKRKLASQTKVKIWRPREK